MECVSVISVSKSTRMLCELLDICHYLIMSQSSYRMQRNKLKTPPFFPDNAFQLSD